MLNNESSPDPGALFSAIRLAGRKRVVAAVSGGGDSLALLFLLHDHLATLPDAPSLLAVTVDHGLRAESGAEAAMVGRLAAANGISHRILRWEGPKPATGVSAAAREARFSLLAKAAIDAEADLVLTAHTAEDQAETLAMRLERGEGRGAAGIAPATLYDGRVWFMRPLLTVRRAALRTFLRSRDIPWIDDPSNRDRRFERARKRQEIDSGAVPELSRKAESAAKTREETGRRAAALIAEAVTKAAPGLLCLRRAAFSTAEPDIIVYTLRILLAVAGGTAHLPDEARAAAIVDLAQERKDFRATLSRAVVAGRRDHIYLHREIRNLPQTPIAERLVWDGRYRLFMRAPSQDLVIAPFGAENARESDVSDLKAPRGLVRTALAAEPALWRGVRCLGHAAESPSVTIRPVAGPWARLLPAFDLAPARAVSELLAGDLPPEPPWHGHKEALR